MAKQMKLLTGRVSCSVPIRDQTHFMIIHTLVRKEKVGKGKRPGKKNQQVNMTLNCCEDAIHNELDLELSSSTSLLFPYGVGCYCTVATNGSTSDNPDLFRTRILGTVLEYEQFIQSRPVHWCHCCDRFLFVNQVSHLSRNANNQMIVQIKFQQHHRTLLYLLHIFTPIQNAVRSCSSLNLLNFDFVPECHIMP